MTVCMFKVTDVRVVNMNELSNIIPLKESSHMSTSHHVSHTPPQPVAALRDGFLANDAEFLKKAEREVCMCIIAFSRSSLHSLAHHSDCLRCDQ